MYRGARPRYAGDPDFVSGEGSRAGGGRWNPPNSFRTVYSSLLAGTVLAEALAGTQAYGIPDADALPLTLRSVVCRLNAVVDLTDPRVQARLGLDMKSVIKEDWRAAKQTGVETLSQAIGHSAQTAGIEGLLVPSALGQGVNLVIFPDNLLNESSLTLDSMA